MIIIMALNDLLLNFSITLIKVIVGLLFVVIIFKIINFVCKKIEKKLLEKRKIDSMILDFLSPIITIGLKTIVGICYIGFIGIETSSIIAAISSVGLAIGLALQGSLSNFAGGFVILIMRPFKIGDYIETCGESGFVENIHIFYTKLVTIDNKVIYIPNGEVASSTIVDENTKSTRRINLVFSIGYGNDYNKVKKIINKCIDDTNLKLDNTETFINIVDSNDTSINITVRVWCKSEDYWNLFFILQENIRLSFIENKIYSPYFQVDFAKTNKSV